MLKNKTKLENENQAYKFIGYDTCGNREFLVNVKENTEQSKSTYDIDDGLLDDYDYEYDEIENDKKDGISTSVNDFKDTDLTAEKFF